jgi:hypothetical protein
MYLCRFKRAELVYLSHVLELDTIAWSNRLKPSPELAMAVTCCRLRYPNDWAILCDHFGRSRGWLSTVFTDVIEFIDGRWKHLLQWHPRLDNKRRIKWFAETIRRKGGGVNIWGFVDGTFRGFRRPTQRQRDYYSGHYHGHGFKYQAIVTPDGLVSSLIGPFHGRDNDWSIWQQSGVAEKLTVILNRGRRQGLGMYLYGDLAYSQHIGIMAPYKHHLGFRYLDPGQAVFNRRLAKVRIAVEHAFGQTQSLWTYTAFSGGLQSGSQAVASFFRTAVLFTNLYTCATGHSQSSTRFVCPPPTVRQYLELEPEEVPEW